ncbi:VOC family protein [Streptodolium elevatio]
MTGTDLTLASCALAVHDVDAALGFYRDVLGFEVCEDVGPDGGRRIHVRPPSQPDVRILLAAPDTDPGVPSDDRHAIGELLAKGLLSRLIFTTGDCDATFRHIEATGAEVMQEPIDQPDGVRDCAFLDPSGNILRFTQPTRALPPPAPRRARTATDHETS